MLSKAGGEKEEGSKMEEGFPAVFPNIRTSSLRRLGGLKEESCFSVIKCLVPYIQYVKNLEKL